MTDSGAPRFPARPQPTVGILEAALEAQRRRWAQGDRRPVEALLREHPALHDDGEAILDLIYNEVLLRRAAGEEPRLEEYTGRFPRLAADLGKQFAVDAACEGATHLAPPGTGTLSGDEDAVATGQVAPAVPGYEVLDELGRGGMGVVYRARQAGLGRLVALKVILAGAHAGPDERARFRAEAEAVARLQHPNVVQVYEVGEQDGQPFFSLEFCAGGSLHGRLAGTPLPAQEAAGLVQTLARAVHAAHGHGIIHRDLKPANVLLAEDGTPKITDFGLARRLDGSGRTRSGELLGTPSYMAPEQARGQGKAAGPPADVYSLGAILYECLTGRPPFRAATWPETLHQVLAEEPVPPRRLNAAVPRDLNTVCLKCLEKDPRNRYASADDLADDLRRFGAGEPVTARPVRWPGRAWRWASRHPARAALMAAVLALVAGGGGTAWWAQQRRLATDTAVAGLLGEAEVLREQARSRPLEDADKYGDALATARKARQFAEDGGASAGLRRRAANLVGDLTEELSAGNRDRELLRALLEVRGPAPGPRFQKDDQGLMARLAEPSAEEQFRAALHAWDPAFDVDGLSTGEAAARLMTRPPAVVLEVIAALDEWAAERRRQGMPEETWKRMADLAQALDASPDTKRRQLRDLLARDALRREAALGALAAALRPVPVPFDPGPGEDRARVRRLAEETDAASEPVLGLLTLARALQEAADEPRAERLLRDAVWARPREVVLRHALGRLFEDQGRWAEAIECYEAARALRPELGAYLAAALVRAGRARQALPLLQRLAAEQPDSPRLQWLHGSCLFRLGRFQEAEGPCRNALRLAPEFAEAHYNLGCVLDALGRFPAAAAAYREAIRLKPDIPEAYVNLGNALEISGRAKEAEEACRQALRIKREFPEAYKAHNALGNALSAQGRHRDAEAEYREAVRLRPDFAEAHYNLGRALTFQSRFPEAEAAYRDTLQIKPDFALAHVNLGYVLRGQGRYAEALEALRRGDALGRKTPGWDCPSADLIRDCERLVELDQRLASILGGAEPATAAEAIELAMHCWPKRLNTAAVRLYARAFADDPRIAADPRHRHRYNAACAAALAAAGQVEAAKNLPDKVACMLRRQALHWLRADLTRYEKLAEPRERSGLQFVRQSMRHWRQDADLASVRDTQALGRLPDDERNAWRRLWDDIDRLLWELRATK
jgi:serine/threonine-protein kinase